MWVAPGSVPGTLPGRFELAPLRPNPSQGETFVDFELVVPSRVVLDVFDAQGRRVKRIADEWFTAGHNVSTWRGDDQDGRALESGVYFIRMQVGVFQATRRTVRVR